MSQKNREQWLAQAVDLVRPWFTEAGYDLPSRIHVSTGFPSKKALAAKGRRIGECWNPNVSSDGAPHVFISPVLADGVRVLGVLIHELIHAAIGTEHGHKGPFKSAMKPLGLTGKATATEESPELVERLNALLNGELGAYPHPSFNAVALQKELDSKKQTTRLLKAVCATGDESEGKVYTVRITKVHLDRFGPPICPECLKRMKVDGWESDDLDEADD